MGNKYLYIDDDNHENAVEKIDGFLSENLIIETVQHSNSWEEQLKYSKLPILGYPLLDGRQSAPV